MSSVIWRVLAVVRCSLLVLQCGWFDVVVCCACCSLCGVRCSVFDVPCLVAVVCCLLIVGYRLLFPVGCWMCWVVACCSLHDVRHSR